MSKLIRYLIANSYSAMSQEPDENGSVWFPISKYGDFPNEAYDPRTKRSIQTVQRFDKDAALALQSVFQGILNQSKHMFRGLPIYEGHADDPKLMTKPGHTMRAVGRVKELEVREDGLWGRAVMNAEGISLIKGDAAPYSGTSPFWWTEDTGKGALNGVKITAPVQLESIALTNKPNIDGNWIGLNQEISEQSQEAAQQTKPNENTNMDPKVIREKLGLPEDASDDAVMAKITGLVTENAALKKEKGEVGEKLKETEVKMGEANTAKAKLELQLKDYRKGDVEAALNTAVTSGQITEADKPRWAAVLNTNFEDGKVLLESQGKNAQLNTQNRVADKVDKTKTVHRAELNTQMASYAKEHGLDLKKEKDYDRCFDAVSG